LMAHIGAKLGGGSQGAQLLADLETASAISATEDGSGVQFYIAGYDRPLYKGQFPYGVEGKMLDQDGAAMSVLLHADENRRLFEPEFIRWGEGHDDHSVSIKEEGDSAYLQAFCGRRIDSCRSGYRRHPELVRPRKH